MVALGFGFIATMAYFFYRASFKGMNFPRWRCIWRCG
jgi:cytochrome d ubiquinol oxidase subunit I